jgi:hypothetical protein
MEDNSNSRDDVESPHICSVGGGGPEPHQPPIIIGGGSFFMDFPRLNENEPPQEPIMLDGIPDFTKPRPYKYKLKAGSQRAIEKVGVLTHLRQGGGIRFRTYPAQNIPFPEQLGCQLWIWLQVLRADANPFEPTFEPLKGPPQVVIRGGLEPTPFKLEADKELIGAQPSYKAHNRFRYTHAGYERHFRIGRWRIVDGEGFPVVTQEGLPETGESEDESYQLFVTFHHH